MLLPGMIFLVIFSIIPMFGSVMAFQNFVPAKGIFGSKLVGLAQFRRLFMLPDFRQILENTLIIALSKIIVGTLLAIVFAVLLNECRNVRYKRFIQTAVYLPHFLSWVILAVMFSNIFSYTGIINQLVTALGGEPVMFMISNTWFRPIIIGTDVWKEFGYNAVIYVAAMTSIDPSLYEAATVDGASKWDKLIHITLPGLLPTIIIMLILRMGAIFSVGYEKIMLMYNPATYETADVISTYVYRRAFESGDYCFSASVGLFYSVIYFTIIMLFNKFSKKISEVSLW